MELEWAWAAAWDKRPAGCGPLIVHDSVPAFELVPAAADGSWTEVRRTWALRDVLTSGRSKPAIEALSLLPDDLDAQLMLARFHGFDGQHDKAIAIYDRLADSPHRHAALVGKAGALLDQGHADSALALYDALIAGTPNDREASEGRARALDKLGRTGEAAAEFRRFIALATAGAGLRVRAAQLWLEHH